MGDSRVTVSDVEISHLYDVVADFPFPRILDQAFPAVPAEAWEPCRREYPSLFGRATSPLPRRLLPHPLAGAGRSWQTPA